MKQKIKTLLTFLFFKFMKTHEDEVANAKKLAEKAKANLQVVHQQFEESEAKYSESIEKIRMEMVKMQETFDNSIRERNDLKQVKEQTIKLVEPKE